MTDAQRFHSDTRVSENFSKDAPGVTGSVEWVPADCSRHVRVYYVSSTRLFEETGIILRTPDNQANGRTATDSSVGTVGDIGSGDVF